jgi:hypothetical protein
MYRNVRKEGFCSLQIAAGRGLPIRLEVGMELRGKDPRVRTTVAGQQLFD